MNTPKKLVIVGAGEFGEIACQYFMDDSDYEVVAFAVERTYKDKDQLFGLPIVDFEEIETLYPPKEYSTFVAVSYGKLSRSRRRLYRMCKAAGYHCASYVSSHAFVWKNVKIGENTFVFEGNILQYHAQIGNNVVLWAGNVVGHHSIVHDDCWVSIRVVIAGFSEVGSGCFLGVNSSIGDCVTIADDVVLGAGSVTVKNLDVCAGVYFGNPAHLRTDRNAYQQFGVEADEV